MPETTRCPMCGSDDLRLEADTVRFGYKALVLDCRACGLVFLDQASFTYPEDFYAREYHQTYITHVEPDAFDPRAYFAKMKQAVAPWADRFKALLTGTESVLDVGCSTGHFLELIKDKAGRVAGHDLNRKEVAFCRDDLGLDVSDAPLETRFAPGSFDYITLVYVLEHIARPVEFLASIGRYLKPGGKFVILVPNGRDPLVNFYDIPEFRGFYYCIEHLFYYTPATIGRLFDQAGLAGSVETLQEYPLANHLNWSYRRKPSDTLAARRGAPDVALRPGAPEAAWEAFWAECNETYRRFLLDNGYGDRLWCVVGPR